MSWIYKTEFPWHCGTRASSCPALQGAKSSLHVQPDGVRKVERFSYQEKEALQLSCSKNGSSTEKYKLWIME